MNLVISRIAIFLTIASGSLFPLLPNLLDRQLAETHELYRYLVLGDLFHRARNVALYPRWIADMNGGYGYPEFVFYQPGYFFLHDFVADWFDDFLTRQLASLSLIAIVGGIGIYMLARRYVGRVSSLGVLLVFSLAPYSRINLFVRGDLSEWMLLQGIPWALFCLDLYVERRASSSRQVILSWFGLSVVVAVATYSHPVAVLFLPLLLLGILLTALPSRADIDRDRKRAIQLEVLLAILVGLSLSSPYWLVVALMKPYVASVQVFKEWGETWQNTTSLSNMLWGSWIGKSSSFHETEFLGLPFVLMAFAGWWNGRTIPVLRAAGWLYLAAMLLISSPGRILWHIPPFSLMLFPWRLAVFAPALQALCSIGILVNDVKCYKSHHGMFWIGVVGLFLYSIASPYQYKPWLALGKLGQPELNCLLDFTRTARPLSYPATMDMGEWQPSWVKEKTLGPARLQDGISGCEPIRDRFESLLKEHFKHESLLVPIPQHIVEPLGGGWSVEPIGESENGWIVDYHLVGSMPGSLLINQLYLPGWRIVLKSLDNTHTRILRGESNSGLIKVDLPEGEWQLQARYDLPFHVQLIFVSVLISAVMVSLLFCFRLQREAVAK